MSSSYRVLLARPGALRLAAASGVGWWAFNGYGLALVLAIQSATGSFAVAGGTTAAFAAGSALLAPVRGGVVDRRGRPALLALASLHTVALAVLVAACTRSGPPALLLVGAAAAAGATVPPLVGTARLVWGQIAGPGLSRTAHAFNATLGEAAAIGSPAVTAVIAAAASPALALALLAPGVGVAALGLTWRTPQPGAPSRAAGRRRGDAFGLVRSSPGLRWLMLGDVLSGAWLAGLEVGAVATAVAADRPAGAGLPLLALAVGGIVAALWSGSRHASAPAQARFVWGAVGAAVVLPWAVIAPGLAPLTIVAGLAGLAYGLTNVALFELVDRVAAPGRAVEAFTWITTAQATGLAIGGLGAGVLAETSPGHAVVLVGAVPALAAAAAIAARPALADGPGALGERRSAQSNAPR